MSLILTGSGGQGGGQVLPGYVALDAATPAPLAGTVNDFEPTGREGVNGIILNASAAFTVTGIRKGTANQLLFLSNQSAFTGTFTANDAGSFAINRFASAFSLPPGTGILLVYSQVLRLWIPLSAAGGGGGGTPSAPNGSVQFDNAGSFGGSADLVWNNALHLLLLGASNPGGFSLNGALYLPSVQSIVLPAGNTNDEALTLTASTIRLSGDAGGTSALTGIVGVADQKLTLINVSANNIVLAHNSGASSAGNKFLCPVAADFTLLQNTSVDLWYDNISTAWRVLA